MIVLLLSVPFFSFAQVVGDCAGGNYKQYIHANELSALLHTGGYMFREDLAENVESLPQPYAVAMPVVTQGLWLAGIQSGELKVSASIYGADNYYDYYPGPIPEEGIPSFSDCQKWDQIWCVYRHEIEQHLIDFLDNGIIDDTIKTILGWPAYGNPHFFDIYGFELPAQNDQLAPFHDTDNNGIYDALHGDYPVVTQSQILPEQICWNIINDIGNLHGDSGGTPMAVEIHQTTWGYYCINNPQLNKTIFASHKLVNHSTKMIDSLYIGLWTDFQIGASHNDYIGFYLPTNTAYAYNGEQQDEFIDSPLPVPAITLLNREMDYAMYLQRDGEDFPYEPATTGYPSSPLQHYHLLSGYWRDGSPLTFNGSGYDTTSQLITNFVFPGYPPNLQEWSARTSGLPTNWFSSIMSTYVDALPPDSSITIDIAYSYFREDVEGFLGNIDVMYEGVEKLSSWYENQFGNICRPYAHCQEDCVWPGDLNSDGIANHYDLLTLGTTITQAGTPREGSYSWGPKASDDWEDTQYNGENLKHIDANADGLITTDDFFITLSNYNKQRPLYESEDLLLSSTEEGLYIDRPGVVNNSLENVEAGIQFWLNIKLEGYDTLKGIAFEMEFDPRFFNTFKPFVAENFNSDLLQYTQAYPSLGRLHFAHFAMEETDYITPNDSMIMVLVKTADDLASYPSNSTQFRFFNAKGITINGEEILIKSKNTIMTFESPSSTNGKNDKQAISIFPNPAHDWIHIDNKHYQSSIISLYNSMGQQVLQVLPSDRKQYSLDISVFPPGLYFVCVHSNNHSTTNPLIIY